MPSKRHSIRFFTIFGLAACVFGCADWPLYQNMPSTNAKTIGPNEDPRSGLTVDWSETSEEQEPNDLPAEAMDIQVGDGLIVEGTLSGLGWNPDASVPRVSPCGDALAFPPSAPGTYTGDVDWITLNPTELGLLCFQLDAQDDVLDHEPRIDAVLYELDDCLEPVSVFVHPADQQPIGADQPAGKTRWAITVQANTPVGIGIAGFWPDDVNLDWTWSAHLSMVPAVDGAGDTLCPELK